MITLENRHVLEKKLGKSVPSGDPKITISLSALSAIMDAARTEERGKNPKKEPETSFERMVRDIMK